MTIQEAASDEKARGRQRDVGSTRGSDKARPIQRRGSRAQQLDLGFRSLAVGAIAALAAPRALARILGLHRRRGLFRATRSSPVGPLALAALSGASVVALLDRRKKQRKGGPLTVQRSITIGKTPQELHEMLRSTETFSRILERVVEIKPVNGSRMHWTVRVGRGRKLEWDQRILEDRFGESMSWESSPGSAVHNAFSVHFRPAPKGWGTEVTLRLRVNLEDHLLGAVAKHLGPVPGGLASKALHRFKSLAETGEIPTLTQQPAARNGGRDV